ncbi:MAG: hypothetical protein JWN55_868, partial [Frankiales bacterium]|nr:hypothetical protein [Frankiales bacterium]
MTVRVEVAGESLRAAQQQALATLQADDVPARLRAHDATLWGPEAEPEAAVRLGW